MKFKSGVLICMMLIMCTASCYGQYSESISTSRPGQSFRANTVGKGVLQYEHGYSFAKTKEKYSSIWDWKNITTSFHTNMNLLRVGISEKVEFNLGSTFISSNSKTTYDAFLSSSDKYQSSFYANPVDFGFRVYLNDQKGIIPAFGLGTYISIPFVGDDFDFKETMAIVNLVGTWNFTDAFGLTSNINIFSNRLRNFRRAGSAAFSYTINFHYSLSKFGFFLENYGIMEDSGTANNLSVLRFDGGVTFTPANNYMFDISGGYHSDNKYFSGFFAELGFSWRVDWREKPSEKSE